VVIIGRCAWLAWASGVGVVRQRSWAVLLVYKRAAVLARLASSDVLWWQHGDGSSLMPVRAAYVQVLGRPPALRRPYR